MSADLDRQCALVLGWHTLRGCEALHKGDECIHDQIPNFSTDYRAVRELEDEIERRGLQIAYGTALMWAVGIATHTEYWDDNLAEALFLVLRATPEQRARAFLEAIT